MAPLLTALFLTAQLLRFHFASADLSSSLNGAGINAVFPGDSSYAAASQACTSCFALLQFSVLGPTLSFFSSQSSFHFRTSSDSLSNKCCRCFFYHSTGGCQQCQSSGSRWWCGFLVFLDPCSSILIRLFQHSYVANSLGGQDGSLVIDMSSMKAISIDSSTNTAIIETGNRLGDIALTLNAAGRAMPHGTCPYVGIGGHSGTSSLVFLLPLLQLDRLFYSIWWIRIHV